MENGIFQNGIGCERPADWLVFLRHAFSLSATF